MRRIVSRTAHMACIKWRVIRHQAYQANNGVKISMAIVTMAAESVSSAEGRNEPEEEKHQAGITANQNINNEKSASEKEKMTKRRHHIASHTYVYSHRKGALASK